MCLCLSVCTYMCAHTIDISMSKTGFSFYVGTDQMNWLWALLPQEVDAINSGQVQLGPLGYLSLAGRHPLFWVGRGSSNSWGPVVPVKNPWSWQSSFLQIPPFAPLRILWSKPPRCLKLKLKGAWRLETPLMTWSEDAGLFWHFPSCSTRVLHPR